MYENAQFKYATEAPTVSSQVAQWFQSVDRDRSGEISWQELQSALVNAEGRNFNEVACRLMIGMFDKDKTGTINANEFQQLYNYINEWLTTFRMYDKDQSGNIEEAELTQAFQQMGYRFTPEFMTFLIQRSDLKDHKKMSIDQFIVTCIQIQRFTEAFRTKDTERAGVITIGFEEYLGIALNCSTV
ncbi:peflin [Anthonomus grandis grandis]|uniref:peflin n=1 Tax=Anthonomus grandis grandis TaxID=2921223 RepID=UPI0021669F29|nr:peflin [Anthonomus grandis grandis]